MKYEVCSEKYENNELPRQKTCHYHSDSSKVFLIIFYLTMLVYPMFFLSLSAWTSRHSGAGYSYPDPLKVWGLGWIVTHNILEPDSKVLPSKDGRKLPSLDLTLRDLGLGLWTGTN